MVGRKEWIARGRDPFNPHKSGCHYSVWIWTLVHRNNLGELFSNRR